MWLALITLGGKVDSFIQHPWILLSCQPTLDTQCLTLLTELLASSQSSTTIPDCSYQPVFKFHGHHVPRSEFFCNTLDTRHCVLSSYHVHRYVL